MGGSRLIDRVRGAQTKFRGGGSLNDSEEFEAIKRQLQSEVIESLDFDQVNTTDRDELAGKLRKTLIERVEAKSLPLNRMERERLVDEILDNILGLGPLEPLLRDPEVSDIMVNGPKTVFVERKGKLVKTSVTFTDNKHLMQIIERIVAAVGRRPNELSLENSRSRSRS